jgi:hypothetical protein
VPGRLQSPHTGSACASPPKESFVFASVLENMHVVRRLGSANDSAFLRELQDPLPLDRFPDADCHRSNGVELRRKQKGAEVHARIKAAR